MSILITSLVKISILGNGMGSFLLLYICLSSFQLINYQIRNSNIYLLQGQNLGDEKSLSISMPFLMHHTKRVLHEIIDRVLFF
jgi:hypothetical protein